RAAGRSAVSRRSTAHLSVQPGDVAAGGFAGDHTVGQDPVTAHEGVGDGGAELETFERRVFLGGFGVRSAYGPGAMGVDDRDIGVDTFGEPALTGQAVAVGRVRGGELGDPAQRKTTLAALGDQAGQQVFGTAETGLRGEHIVAVLAEFDLVLAAGVIGNDPVDVPGEQMLPQRLDIFA